MVPVTHKHSDIALLTKAGKKSRKGEKEVGWRGWEEGRKRGMEGGNV